MESHDSSFNYVPKNGAAVCDTHENFRGGSVSPQDASSALPPEAGLLYHPLSQHQSHVVRDHPLINDIKQTIQEPFPLHGAPECRIRCWSETDFKAYLTLHNKECQFRAVDDFSSNPATQQRLFSELVAAMTYLGDDCVDRHSRPHLQSIAS